MSDSQVALIGLADRAARILRDRIINGELRPGTALREPALSSELEVSRNTLREAFRQLALQGLIVQEMYKGASVRLLGSEEIREIYTIRRTLETRGIEESAFATTLDNRAMQQSIEAAGACWDAEQWRQCGTYSLKFHRQIVGLLGSPRLDDLFQIVCAQLRLAFFMVADEQTFQQPWQERDKELCHLICTGRRLEAVRMLDAYLRDSERTVLDSARLAANRLPVRRRRSASEAFSTPAAGSEGSAVRFDQDSRPSVSFSKGALLRPEWESER